MRYAAIARHYKSSMARTGPSRYQARPAVQLLNLWWRLNMQVKRSDRYWSWTGVRLRLWLRLTFVIALLLPKGFKSETRLLAP